jgi:L-2-hydroxyglutarate oxidase LhgO
MTSAAMRDVEHIDCVVAGAGVVGLAVARELAARGNETIVLEAESVIGSGISSRNSEVIHAGIYYPRGSLKARLCVRGKQLLYDYCRARGIEHRACGKLIVASSAVERDRLHGLMAAAAANDVNDLTTLDAAEVRALEPALVCDSALYSPSSGIIDSHGLMNSLRADLEQAGGIIAFDSPIRAGRCEPEGILIKAGDHSPVEISARLFVNCAGLGAQGIARSLIGLPERFVPALWYAKGSYFLLSGGAPFSHLVYPIPEGGGLGVHVTLDMAGQARFGPDVEWVSDLDYQVDPRRVDGFYAAIRRYWPALPDGSLRPGYAGIRPKITAQNQGDSDFVVQGEAVHGVRGLVNLFGIESPGLTAALALAEHVCNLVS